MKEIDRMALRRVLERTQRAEEMCVRAWNECKLGDIANQPEHPLAQALSACAEARRWAVALLED